MLLKKAIVLKQKKEYTPSLFVFIANPTLFPSNVKEEPYGMIQKNKKNDI